MHHICCAHSYLQIISAVHEPDVKGTSDASADIEDAVFTQVDAAQLGFEKCEGGVISNCTGGPRLGRPLGDRHNTPEEAAHRASAKPGVEIEKLQIDGCNRFRRKVGDGDAVRNHGEPEGGLVQRVVEIVPPGLQEQAPGLAPVVPVLDEGIRVLVKVSYLLLR